MHCFRTCLWVHKKFQAVGLIHSLQEILTRIKARPHELCLKYGWERWRPQEDVPVSSCRCSHLHFHPFHGFPPSWLHPCWIPSHRFSSQSTRVSLNQLITSLAPHCKIRAAFFCETQESVFSFLNCPSLPSFPVSSRPPPGLFVFQWWGERNGNRREFISIYLVWFDDVSTIKKFLLSYGRGSRENCLIQGSPG